MKYSCNPGKIIILSGTRPRPPVLEVFIPDRVKAAARAGILRTDPKAARFFYDFRFLDAAAETTKSAGRRITAVSVSDPEL